MKKFLDPLILAGLLQLLQNKFICYFTSFPGGRTGGWVGVSIENKTNSAQFQLELGLRLATFT